MLRYLATGFRRFGLFPMQPHVRKHWEIYAVIDGKLGCLFPKKQEYELKSRYLWVFPPETSHGWIGEKSNRCRVVVFAFANIPFPLNEVSRKNQYYGHSLSEIECLRLLAIEKELRPHLQSPNSFSPLYFQKAVLELATIALSDKVPMVFEKSAALASQKLENALIWFSENMSKNPSLDEISKAIGTPVSQLRRLFWKVQKRAPKSALTEVRMQRAAQLLGQSNMKLDEIASQCGFIYSSAFCRAFKAAYRCSPNVWRKALPRGYREPSS